MKRQTLRELCKFASGLVVADFLTDLLFLAKGLLPILFLGITIGPRGAVLGMIFDVIFFAFLVHFGWRIKETPKDEERIFHRASGIVFGLVALLHLLRIIFGWQFNLFGWAAPYWVSGIGTIVAAFLSYVSFELTKK